MKRIFSFIFSILSFVIILSCVSMVSFADELVDVEETQLGNTSTYYSFEAATKTLTISGTGSTPAFSTSSAHPFYELRYKNAIEHIVVEEGITHLGNYLLYSIGAVDVKLPSTLTSIGNSAMSNMNSIKSVELPEGLITIDVSAFRYCTVLEKIIIPSAVTKIGTTAFENCISLKSVIFEDMYSAVSVGRSAFLYCSSLKSVSIPKRATLSAYSFGFEKASKVGAYNDFVLNVYRDSPAFNNYCGNNNYLVNPDNYNIINEFIIREGQCVECEYYDYAASYEEEMIFIFTPDISDCYTFFSVGDTETVDVNCTLYDSKGAELEHNEDVIPDDDLDFSITYYLEAGKTYTFKVNCVSFVSVGKFSVNLINSHSYESVVTLPTLTEDGYTTYTCEYCGDSYKADFVNRTGVKVTGRVVLMEAPDGSHTHNLPIANANITVDGNNLTITDENGDFEFYTLPTANELNINCEFSVDRTFKITCDENMEMKLGNISLFHFDYVLDGYVNAKDFAFLRAVYGAYSQEDEELYISLDYNRDGIIDDNDFVYALNFLTYGKITETIYN